MYQKLFALYIFGLAAALQSAIPVAFLGLTALYCYLGLSTKLH